MKILVTGHHGFIGQHMMARLKASGHDVTGYEWDETQFPEVEGLDAVIHLGAISATTYPDLEQIMRQNYDFSVRLLQDCITHQVPLQYASSASVYGQTTHFTEDGALAPQSYYAWTKYLFDRYAQDYLDRGIAVTGLRYFNVFGHSGEEHKGGMSSPYHKFREQALATGRIKLFRNSEDYLRDFVCVEDVVDVSARLLETPASGVFNVGTGQATSFQAVAEAMARVCQAKIDYIDMPDAVKNQYQAFTRANLDRLNGVMDKTWVSILDYIDNGGV